MVTTHLRPKRQCQADNRESRNSPLPLGTSLCTRSVLRMRGLSSDKVPASRVAPDRQATSSLTIPRSLAFFRSLRCPKRESSTSLSFSPLLLCGEVQNSSRFHIWNSANKPGSQRCVAQRRDFPDQLWAASSELAFCGQLTTKRCVIRATFAARGICSSSKNFSVSSSVRRCLRTTGEIA